MFKKYKKHCLVGLGIIFFISFICISLNFTEKDKTQIDNEKMSVFLLYENSLVEASRTTTRSTTKEKIKDVIAYMKEDTKPFQNLLSKKSVLNKVEIKDEKAIIDFKKLEYKEKHELRVLESLIYSCTQFEEVQSIQIMIQGKVLDKMPVKKTMIGDTTRAYGINHLESNQRYLHIGNQVTLFYETKIENKIYPFYQSIKVNNNQDYNEIFEEMLKPLKSGSLSISPLIEENISKDKNCELNNDILSLYLNNIYDDKKGIKKNVLSFLKNNFKSFPQLKYLQIYNDGKVVSVDGKNKIEL